ncbi:MAG: UDP-glucose/GDP-mannose dehydrogenase family protein [Candidatus Woesearchaeota archaeon]|jgi:UDPglucose 6-dehydrogenase|nr:UDP-glucose/GDP-mannose dehydrogenase family protein [Candidatus Woesearchaeota archaeon]MDP7623039.1 UDP-glucose/GDP-mannose dehydrogenase family protein [Candidatus Woesearchaeota archaeon]HJN56719.1 UDP-glucose/GDP-mannose dehydrogenase family protein [Candidatus Woesearchaeota archaeon]|tara:strand:- start:3711 stop:5000 length:1290 start_codon:yes stop_codon:yes gene_type:complete
MKLAVIGVGYVGLVTGTCFAELGNDVICVDIDKDKINKLNKGIIPIFEPGLKELVDKNVKENRLKFANNNKEAIEHGDVIFICVGTPPKHDGETDLKYVESAAMEIAETMDSYKIIVHKSTVPVETGERVKELIQKNIKQGIEFDVVSNPEFLREGSAISDTMGPDRIVIGTDSKKAAEIMKKLYNPIKSPLIVTDIRSAELIKHASNAFLATKISFMNAVSRICELADADVEKVAEGMGYDKRIGRDFLNAGIGYGGFCFPKDVQAFIKIAEKYNYDYKLLKATHQINEDQKIFFVEKVKNAVKDLNGKNIGVLGLAFKPNTDDMRFAPSEDIIPKLQKEGAKIKAYDPEAMERAKSTLKIDYCNNPYEAAKDADCLLILTEWNEFKEMDLKKIKSTMKVPLIIDGRNIYNLEEMKKLGFEYLSIGRK